MAPQNKPLVVFDPLRENRGNLGDPGIRFEELQHSLVLPSQRHDLGRGWKHAHTECRPVDVDGGQLIGNEIFRSTLSLSREALINQANNLSDLTWSSSTRLISVSVLSS